MMDNIVIPRQFVIDLRAAKMQQLRALKAKIAQYERWLKLSSSNELSDHYPPLVPTPPEPNVTPKRDRESEWS